MFGALAVGVGVACLAGTIWGAIAAPSGSSVLVCLIASAHGLICAAFAVAAGAGIAGLERLGFWRWARAWVGRRKNSTIVAVASGVGLLLGGGAAGAVYLLGLEVRALPWGLASALGFCLLSGGVVARLLVIHPHVMVRRGLLAGVVLLVALGTFGVAWVSDYRGPEAVSALEAGGISGRVVHAARNSKDSDGDGYPVAFCDGDCDCDDTAESINPGADEVVDNGVDEDCDGADLTGKELAAMLGGGALGNPAEVVGAAGTGVTPAVSGSSSHSGAGPVVPTPAGTTAEPGLKDVTPNKVVKPQWQRRYNVLLIVMDTVRADHLSFMGYKRKTSPKMDVLATESIVFTQARVQGSMTRESLPTIFTGRYFEEIHRHDQEWPSIHADNLMLAERFKDAGYKTYGITSFIYVVPHFGFAQGFDLYETRILQERAKVHWNRTSDLVTDYTLAAVDNMKKDAPDTPWFAFAHYADPHAGYQRHPESPRFGGFTADIYDEEIFFTDLHIGRLIQGLRDRDVMKDTVVIITSDHGEGLRRHEDHGGIYHGQHLYDTLVHVPLVFTVPGLAGRTVAEPVGAVDIVPTLVELIGLPTDVGEPISGRSLVPQLIDRQPRRKRGPVFMTKFRPATRAKVAMVDWPYKVVWNVPINRWELYDLAQDKGEKRNLVKKPEHLERLKKYQRTVKTWRSHVLKRRPSRKEGWKEPAP